MRLMWPIVAPAEKREKFKIRLVFQPLEEFMEEQQERLFQNPDYLRTLELKEHRWFRELHL